MDFEIFWRYSDFAPISTLQGAKPKVIYNPIGVFGDLHLLDFDNTKGTHCWPSIVIMEVVEHLGPSISNPCWRCHDTWGFFFGPKPCNKQGLAVHYSFV